jgi:hypothetical protein
MNLTSPTPCCLAAKGERGRVDEWFGERKRESDILYLWLTAKNPFKWKP